MYRISRGINRQKNGFKNRKRGRYYEILRNKNWKGKINGKPRRKTIRICNCCGAWLSYEDIREKVSENRGWDQE